MERELLKEILLEQRKRIEKAKNGDFVKREKLGEMPDFVGMKHSIVITGVRRCGKSVFLSQIIKNFFPESYYYVSFDDERLAGFELKDFSRLYEVCLELFGESKTFFLDEVQNITGWEKWVGRMYEDGFKFFITGSNARLLSKELATLLTGRHLQFTLFPFSFREFLDFCGLGLKKDDVYLAERRALIIKQFSRYLKDGGFPEYLKYGRIEILQEYFNDIIQRDIVERYGVKNIKQLKELARYLITNTGNLTTYNRLKKLTGMKSVNTVMNYTLYLETSYLLFRVPFFSHSLRKQAANPFKVFAMDTGLRNAISFKFSKDAGRLYETVVAVELKRKNRDVYYWQNPQREEVDFIVRNGGGEETEQLIQVCYDVGDAGTKEREVRSLIEASKELNCKDLLVITGDYEAEEKVPDGNNIRFVPLWKWLVTQ